MVERAQLGEQQRRALVLRQAAEVGEQLAHGLAPLDGDEQPVDRRLGALERDVRPSRPQQRDAAVAGDREQPRTHVERPVAAGELPERGQERVLEHVLGLLARAEHMAAEAEDRGVVAVVERFERSIVPGARERDEPRVAGQAQQARRRAGATRMGHRDGSILHAGIIRTWGM